MDMGVDGTATSVPDCLVRPQIRMMGLLTDDKYLDFQSQLDKALNSKGPIGLELTTNGGDADLARRICMDIHFFGERLGREFWFIGKTIVYSAGVTILAGFPRERRFITRDCVLLIHERHVDMSLQLSGPLSSSLQRAQEMENELTASIEIERDGFEMLCRDTDVSVGECIEKAKTSWYVKADEARKLRLVEGVL